MLTCRIRRDHAQSKVQHVSGTVEEGTHPEMNRKPVPQRVTEHFHVLNAALHGCSAVVCDVEVKGVYLECKHQKRHQLLVMVTVLRIPQGLKLCPEGLSALKLVVLHRSSSCKQTSLNFFIFFFKQ